MHVSFDYNKRTPGYVTEALTIYYKAKQLFSHKMLNIHIILIMSITLFSVNVIVQFNFQYVDYQVFGS